jgi:hypothetical protein
MQLGGKTSRFENYLIAAGDGSNTSGMLDEREKDERGRWNKGLPKAVGLFPYQFHVQQMENSQLKEIEPERFATINTQTIGNNRQTNIHADVWGYNDKKQTTVVIEKKSKSYILFGSGETRFLSPDSTFSEGKTFYSLINELQNVWIKNLNEAIYGKNGIQSDIDYWKTQTKVAYDEIKATEVGISSFNIANYNTSNQGIKKRKKDQQKLVEMNERLEFCKQKVAFHEKKKADALTLLASYQKKLTQYKELLGYNWEKWSQKENLYTFEDGATFNLLTQEFRFPPSKSPESFEVRLLAIPFSALSNEADEVMLHLAISDVAPGFDRPIQLAASDLFASNAYALKNNLFETTDSVAILRAFELMQKKPTINIVARAQGIAQWTEGHIQKMTPAIGLPSYPGETKEEREKSKLDSTFSRLRRSEVFLGFQNESVTIEVNAYTDPVQSNFEPQNAQLKEWISTGKINQNDALSVYRSAALLKHLKLELNIKSGQYLSRDLAKIVIDHLNKAIDKARISVGTMSIALSEL